MKIENKPILIQGAMETEITTIKEKMQNVEKIELYGYTFYKGEIKGYPIILSKTQVGLINVTSATIIGIINFSPIIIINQGIAGGITKDIHKGDIILGETCININSYQTPIKQEKEGSNSLQWELKTFKEGKDELVILESNKELLNFAYEKAREKKQVCKKGRIGSADAWNAEKDRLLWFSKNYEIMCEDMETVAVYQVANKMKIPALGIRILSDNMLLEEEYDKSVSKAVQEFVSFIVEEYIKNLTNI